MIMKRTILTSVAVAAVSVAAYAQEYPVIPDGYDYEGVSDYFNQCLQGQVLDNYSVQPFEGGRFAVSHVNAGDVSSAIWQLWVNANTSFSEHKLNNGKKLYQLTQGVQWSYDIPKDLEPYIWNISHPGDNGTREYARMKYIFGFNGQLSGPAPMFINIHGSGPVADEWTLAQQVCRGDNDSPKIYFIAQIPNGGVSDNYSWYRWFQCSKQWVWEKVFRQAFLRSDIDHNGLYFVGISEGAYGSQRLGAFYADYLAGIGPMAGGEPLTNAPAENMRHVAFSLRTGEYDTSFSRHLFTAYAGTYLDKLASKYPGDYPHNVIVEPGQPHTLQKYNNATTPWLLEYRRNPVPRHVCWENFAMDGRYRDGFYNLRVFERSNTDEDSRGYYELDIDDDNNIDIRVSTVYEQVLEWDSSSAHLPLYIDKKYAPATKGRFKVYLNDRLVDMGRPVTLTVNGVKLYEGMVTPTVEDIVNSIADYYDPERIFTSSIMVDLSSMTAKTPVAGIDSVTVDGDESPAEYYNLQGIRVDNPVKGRMYIRRQGTTVTRILM